MERERTLLRTEDALEKRDARHTHANEATAG